MNEKKQESQRSTIPIPFLKTPKIRGKLSRLKTSSTSNIDYINATAHTVWTPQELLVLQEGLNDSKNFSNALERYVFIASLLPRKTVRDVVFQITCLLRARTTQEVEMSSKLREKQKAAPISSTTVTIAPAVPKTLSVNSTLICTPISPSLATKKKDSTKIGKQKPLEELKNITNEDRIQSFGISTSTTDTTDNIMERKVGELLQANILTINKMRENMLTTKLPANIDLMVKFKDTCDSILHLLNSVNSQMPPLPVEIDVSLIQPGTLCSSNQIDV